VRTGPLIDEVWASDASWSGPLRILPDGGCDLIWIGDDLLVAGPDSRARMVVREPGTSEACGVRFVPGAARAALGWSGASLADSVRPAREVLGAEVAGRLAEQLAATPASERPTVLTEWASGFDRAVDRRPPVVAAAVAMVASDPSVRVGALADRLGYSDRQLRRLMLQEVGYGPKRLARILRLLRTVRRAAAEPAVTLAELAALEHFVDQAHLCHECRALAGTTASELLAR
jgi:AraC-like DNA-binding protein